MHGVQSEQWRRRYDDHPFPRTSVGLRHQSATIELIGREQAPEPSAVVCVEQDEYLGAQGEEVDKGQRLPEVDLFKRVQVLQYRSVGILPLLRQVTEVESDVLDPRVPEQEIADGFELLVSLAGANIRIVRRNPPRQRLRNAGGPMLQKAQLTPPCQEQKEEEVTRGYLWLTTTKSLSLPSIPSTMSFAVTSITCIVSCIL